MRFREVLVQTESQSVLATAKTTYQVKVDDNFHYQDEGARTGAGTYDNLEDAVAHCKAIVDRFLLANLTGLPPSKWSEPMLWF